MKVIKPLTITDAMLVSSTAAETDHPLWSAGATYAQGDLCIRVATHRVYERLVAGVTATPPEDDTANWLDIGPTNRWAMFDQQVGTTTASPGPLTVVLEPGLAGALALIGLVGSSASVTVVDTASGATVYSAATVLDAAIITDWWQYLTSPIRQQTSWVLTGLPAYQGARVTVTIASSGTAACAALLLGDVYDLGDTVGQPRLSILDYSRKTTDELGTTTFVRRANSLRLQADALVTLAAMPSVVSVLSDLRATPAVWIPMDGPAYAAATVYGFFRDWTLAVAYAAHQLLTLEIEGLT